MKTEPALPLVKDPLSLASLPGSRNGQSGHLRAPPRCAGHPSRAGDGPEDVPPRSYQASPASLAHDASPRSLLEPENRWLAISTLVLPPQGSGIISPPPCLQVIRSGPPNLCHHSPLHSPVLSPPSPSSLPQSRHKITQPKTHKNKPNSHRGQIR